MTDADTTPAADAAPETGEEGAETTEQAATTTPRLGLHTMLTRDSDMASRPGFRNPSNKRSKAQSKGQAKRSRKKRR